MKIATIGFTKKSAEEFFDALRAAGVVRVVDVRLNNVNQLAGFTKKDDLAFFLKAIGGMDYVHEPLLAPTQDLMDAFKKNGLDWQSFQSQFLDLMERRHIEDRLSKDMLSDGCLLCSEDKPHHCHRRLVAEYLSHHWGSVDVKHLA